MGGELFYLSIGLVSKCYISIIVVLLVGFTVFGLINFKKRTKAEVESKIAKKKLEESYMELGEAYQQVKVTESELAEKYEELKEVEERNRKLAYTDFITELPNRTAFSEKLGTFIPNMKKGDAAAVIFLDLDNFKFVNDVLGHSYGDELLIDVTAKISKVLGKNDFVARFGGDEFIILSEQIRNRSECEEMLKRLFGVLQQPFILSNQEFFITMSVGIVMIPENGDTVQEIFKNADAAMYAAKALGKNTYCFYDKSLNYKIALRHEKQEELRKAVAKKQFVVYYQAQIDLRKDEIVGFEALVRWDHPVKGIVPPAEFVQTAEETGMIVPIGEIVLSEALRQLKKWDEEGMHNIHIAVNLSSRQFKDFNFVKMVKHVIQENGISGNQLELEITEAIAIEDIDYSIRVIQELKECGVHFSLDDFGAGCISIQSLKQLPVDNLKIDRSVLSTVMDSGSDQSMVLSIIQLAQELNMVVIAEGVEKDEQAVFLKNVNCNQAQGFLYGKPVPAEKIDLLVKRILTLGGKPGMTLEHILCESM